MHMQTWTAPLPQLPPPSPLRGGNEGGGPSVMNRMTPTPTLPSRGREALSIIRLSRALRLRLPRLPVLETEWARIGGNHV